MNASATVALRGSASLTAATLSGQGIVGDAPVQGALSALLSDAVLAANPLTDQELAAIQDAEEEVAADTDATEPGQIQRIERMGPHADLWVGMSADVAQRLLAEVRRLRLDAERLAHHHDRARQALDAPCPTCRLFDEQQRGEP